MQIGIKKAIPKEESNEATMRQRDKRISRSL